LKNRCSEGTFSQQFGVVFGAGYGGVTVMATASGGAKSRRKITPHSRLLARGCVDGRSREGRFLSACRDELAQHVGGNPSPAERVLIDRLAWLRLHVTLIDEKVSGGSPMSAHDQRAYMAFSNAISRGMRQLGLKGVAARPLTLDEHLRRVEAEAVA
jgi:hypothetical protein